MVEGVSGTLAGSISMEWPCKREGDRSVGVGSISTEATGNELSCLLLPVFVPFRTERWVRKVNLPRGLLGLLAVFLLGSVS